MVCRTRVSARRNVTNLCFWLLKMETMFWIHLPGHNFYDECWFPKLWNDLDLKIVAASWTSTKQGATVDGQHSEDAGQETGSDRLKLRQHAGYHGNISKENRSSEGRNIYRRFFQIRQRNL